MPTRPTSHVWTSGSGWVKKVDVDDRDYSKFETEWWAFLIAVFRWYPDKMLDIFRDDQADYRTEEIYQRVLLRVFARKKDVSVTGTRGMTKTNTKEKYHLVNGLVWPGTQSAYFGPSLVEMAPIASKTFRQLKHDYPALCNEWMVVSDAKEDFHIKTDYNSAFYVRSMRGDNLTEVTAEEYAKEENPPFDYATYSTIVLPAVRLGHNVKGLPDENFVLYKRHSITSAGRKQNHAYETRCKIMKRMVKGDKKAFAIDISWECVVLQQMRPFEWAMGLKEELSVERWMREMESRYTGADEFPILTDEIITESRSYPLMERQHCCKYAGCKLNPQEVIYIVCYDVSYENAKKNAKCALGVWKLTRQEDFIRRDRYLKQLVWLDSWPPPDNAQVQARKVKDVWWRFSHEQGNATYIAIDGWQYGKSVIECLMMDLGDGLPPLCVKDHAEYREAELPGAMAVIYPIKAGGVGVTDPDAEMIRYAQTQFDNHNVQLLVGNIRAGVEHYKKIHGIKNDAMDYRIKHPYQETTALVGEIQNLKAVPGGSGVKEQRISKAIQRDRWSAAKYGLRLAQILEREELISTVRGEGEWGKVFAAFENGDLPIATSGTSSGVEVRSRTVTHRQLGRLF